MTTHDQQVSITAEEYSDLNLVEKLIMAEAVRQAAVYWSQRGSIATAIRKLDKDYEAASKVKNPVTRKKRQQAAASRFRKSARKGFETFDTRVIDRLAEISLANARFKYGIYWGRDPIREAATVDGVLAANKARKLQLSGNIANARLSMLLTRDQIINTYLTSVRKRMSIIHGRRASLAERAIARQTNERNLRTVQRTLAQGAIATAEHAAIVEIADKYRWWSVIDDRTTVRCTNLHRKEFTVNKGPLPPQHYNCRSEVHPVVANLERERRRRFTRGAVPAYHRWLRQQSHDLQNDLLGGKRIGDLYRAGKLDSVPATWRSIRRLLALNGTIRKGRLAEEMQGKWDKYFGHLDLPRRP